MSASVAVKRVIAWQVAEAIKAAKFSKSDLAKRMNTSRLQLDRVLDEADTGLTLDTLSRAAGAWVLDSPITRGDQCITHVELRKPDVGTLRGIKLVELLQLAVVAIRTLLARISTPALTVSDIDGLDPVDLINLGTELLGFFMSRQERGSLPE